MRNFSKTLISMAAVMAVGSAMAAGAMAADLTATYADDTVTFSGVTEGKSQYTLLVVQGTTAEGATEVTYDANESTIKQIDQNDDGTAFTSAVVGELADGSYKVLVGNNDGTIDSGIFTVSSAPVVETKDIIVGDVDGNSKLNGLDVTRLRRYNAEYDTNIGNTGTVYTKADGSGSYIVGDVDGNSKLNGLDVTRLRRYNAEYDTNIGNAGTIIKVNVE